MLPTEILLQVLGSLCIESWDEAWGAFEHDYPDLLACSLVCRDWAAVGQEVLFRAVIFDYPGSGAMPSITRFNSFAKTLEELHVRQSSLPLAVRSLGLHVDRNSTFSNIARVVSLCPNIRSLHIDFDSQLMPQKFSSEDVALLLNAHSVTNLSLSGTQRAEVVPQLLGVWPRITHLFLHFFGYLRRLEVPAALPPPLALRRLCVLDPPVEFCDYIARWTLAVSDITWVARNRGVRDLAPFQASVRRVLLQSTNSDVLPGLAEGLAHLPHLESVILGDHPLKLLPTIPPGVVHLGFSTTSLKPEDILLVSQFLWSRPTVRRVTVFFYRDFPYEAHFASLEMAGLLDLCQIRRMEIEYREFRSGILT